jgi:hypothetical protein
VVANLGGGGQVVVAEDGAERAGDAEGGAEERIAGRSGDRALQSFPFFNSTASAFEE